MSSHFFLNGFSCKISDDNYAVLKLAPGYKAGDIIVPEELNGCPVKTFLISERRIRQKINRIAIPASVEEFRCLDFSFDYNIEIEVDENNSAYYSDGKALYTKDRSKLINFFANGDEEYKIIDGCKFILKNAFCSGNLKRVYFPEGLNVICERAFMDCRDLTELELPNGLTEIKAEAFNNAGIKKITLPPTLKHIGESAFRGNHSALEMTLPEALEEIGHTAFPDNWTLAVNENNKNFCSKDGFILTPDNKKIVCPAQPSEDGVLIIPDYVEEILPDAFHGRQDINKVILPPGLHTIGDRAFMWMARLKDINLENVKFIGKKAFMHCYSLEKIRLKCDEIKADAFLRCTGLVEAEVDCEKIGRSMFYGCAWLRHVKLKNTRVIGDNAFYSTLHLKEIIFPPELEFIDNEAFSYSGLCPLFIPKTVKRLGNLVANSISIKEIHVYDNLESDITVDNDISRSDYTLFVHSAQTDEIKYAVLVIEESRDRRFDFGQYRHKEIVKMFKGGANFDFKKYDAYVDFIAFEKEPVSLLNMYFENISFYNPVSKFEAGMLRLKYGFELDEKTRRNYEILLDVWTKPTAERYASCGQFEKIMNREFYAYISVENLIPLVEESTNWHQLELTALLLQILQEKKQAKRQ